MQKAMFRGFFSTGNMPKEVKELLFNMSERPSDLETIHAKWLAAFKEVMGYEPVYAEEMKTFLAHIDQLNVPMFIGSYRISFCVESGGNMTTNDFALCFEGFMAVLERFRDSRQIPIGLMYQTGKSSKRRTLFFSRQYALRDNVEELPEKIADDLNHFRVHNTLKLFGSIYGN